MPEFIFEVFDSFFVHERGLMVVPQRGIPDEVSERILSVVVGSVIELRLPDSSTFEREVTGVESFGCSDDGGRRYRKIGLSLKHGDGPKIAPRGTQVWLVRDVHKP